MLWFLGAEQPMASLMLAGGAGVGGMLLALAWLARKLLRARAAGRRLQVELDLERRERMFLASILQTTAAFIAVFHPDGRLRFANSHFRALLGELPLEALLPLGDVPGNASALPPTGEASIVGRDGQRRQVLWAVAIVRDDAGEPTQIVTFGFDNTSRRETELSLYQAARLATLGELAAGLAHELNQPFSIIRLASEASLAALDRGSSDAAFLRKKLTRVVGQVERAAAIVANMRIFGRHSQPVLRAIDPTQAIEDVLQLLNAQLHLHRIEVRQEIAPQTWPIIADLMLLEQVLINLLFNARDAIVARRRVSDSPSSGLITITATSGGPGMTAIRVADNGGGIPPAAMSRIFDPFFTTKPPGQGTGLGLALSYGIVRDFGGQITASNGPEGAIFTLELPTATGVPAATGDILAATVAG